MPEVRLSRKAQDDLRDIRAYSKVAFGPGIARKYLEGLRGVFALLREQCRAGMPEAMLGPDVCSFGYRSQRVYYQLIDDRGIIARILHHARDRRFAWTEND